MLVVKGGLPKRYSIITPRTNGDSPLRHHDEQFVVSRRDVGFSHCRTASGGEPLTLQNHSG